MKKSLVFLFLILNLQAFSQDYSIKRLEDSPRHHEWAKVDYNGRTVHCFVAYPEKSVKTPAIIVIHENRGLTDWVRSFADQLAEEGYLAIAPDFLSGFSQKNQRTSDFENSDAARNAIYELNPQQVTADLDAVRKFAEHMTASNGKTAVIGFCWGGSQSFRFATHNKDIKAALVFYGSAPDNMEAIKNISAPVYGFYGENDQRINAGIPATEKMMRDAGKTYKYVIYPGAGHAYMRQGDDPSTDNATKKATQESWERIRNILKDL
jgi:carboxymethylenebutenolidase